MTQTLPDILQTGDRAALSAWLDDPKKKGILMDTVFWNGPIDADLGRDLHALMVRGFETDFDGHPWKVGNTLERCLVRFIHRRDAHAHDQEFFKAVLLYAHTVAPSLTRHDGLEILKGLDFFAWCRDKGLEHYTFFAPLYDLLAQILPLDDALAHVEHKMDTLEGTMPHISMLLAIYGIQAFQQIQPMIARQVAKQHFYYLDPQETKLLALLATGSAHQMLPFLGALPMEPLRAFAPYIIHRHLVKALPR